MYRHLVVAVLAAFTLLWSAPSARASSVTGLSVDNSVPTQSAGARTVYKIGFTTPGGVPALGSITVGLPTGTDFTGYNASSVVDTTAGTAAIGSCGGPSGASVTCGLFSGQSIPAGHAVVVTLNGIANTTTVGAAPTVTVTTTGDTTAATAAVTIGTRNAVASAAVDNASPTTAAGGRTVYVVSFTTSGTGGLANAANSQITLAFPAGTSFAGYNASSIVDPATGTTSIGSCGGPSGTTLTCGLFGGKAIPAGHTVQVTVNGVTNPPAAGTVGLATTSDTGASPGFAVAAANAIGSLAVNNASPTTAAGGRTVYVVSFTTSATGGLANAANSQITLAFPAGTSFAGYNASSIVDPATGTTSIGSCGGPSGTTLTCGLFGGKAIPAGHTVQVTVNGVTNPAANGTLAASTTSDTVASTGVTVLANHPVAAAAVDNASPTAAAGARTVYVVSFTTSATGGLANAANSQITLAFPAGTSFAGYNASSIVDPATGTTSIGSCGGPSGTTLTCGLFGGKAIPAGHTVQVTVNGVTNPPAAGTVGLATTSDTGASPGFAVASAQALSGLTVAPASQTPGAVTNYTIGFTTSPAGGLSNAANSVITLVFPVGTGFTGYNGSSVADATTGSNVGSCGGADTTTRTVTCGLFGGQSIPAGHSVRVTLNNLSNPPTPGPYAVAASTTSDLASGAPAAQGGGAQAAPTPLPAVSPAPSPTPTATPVPQKSVVAAPVKGTVKVRLPGTNTFVDLGSTQGIPVGATVDTRHGTVQLTAVQKPGGKAEIAIFYDGLFKLTQTQATTDLTLNEPLARVPQARARRRGGEEAQDAQAVGQRARLVPHPRARTAPRPSAAPSGSSRTPAPAR